MYICIDSGYLSAEIRSLYLADSESSSIRRVDLTTGGSKLLAGGDPTFADNLFQVLAGLMCGMICGTTCS